MDFNRLRLRLIQLPRGIKRLVVIGADGALLSGALIASLQLVGGQSADSLRGLPSLVAIVLGLSLPLLAAQGMYRAMIRFVGPQLVFAVLRSVTAVSLFLIATHYVLGGGDAMRAASLGLVFWAFALLLLVGSRFWMRFVLLAPASRVERVAIYGAGEAGARLGAALAAGNAFSPVAFIDDNRALEGRSINGVRIYAPQALPGLVSEHQIRRVLLALPSVPRRLRQEILGRLEPLPIHVQTMPDIADLVAGKARVDELSDVDAVDLLGRDPVPPNPQLLDACIRGKVVMVTGAGGSIGAELCRQIVRLGPRRLVLFEISELALYTIENELRALVDAEGLEVPLTPVLGSVHHRGRMRSVVQSFRVQTLYHAAAYKHVPIVEYNMVEGVHNNVVGTWYAAEAAEESGVETFVLISTDKAVSPVNIMGATKRLAELVLQAMTERGARTRFCMVRFGNVLESSGSVVPLFREQIRRGGPVTVTHPEVIRYFMTIPEASQLVIQAGSMGQGGDVFVLDMGKPVRIDDLARRMIHLMGLSVRDEKNPDGDIVIEYMGLRPAEKLFEELLIGNNVMGTEHPMILRALEESLPWSELRPYLDALIERANAFDCEACREILRQSVPGYAPANGIDDLVWQASRAVAPAAGAKVALLNERRAGHKSGS